MENSRSSCCPRYPAHSLWAGQRICNHVSLMRRIRIFSKVLGSQENRDFRLLNPWGELCQIEFKRSGAVNTVPIGALPVTALRKPCEDTKRVQTLIVCSPAY